MPRSSSPRASVNSHRSPRSWARAAPAAYATRTRGPRNPSSHPAGIYIYVYVCIFVCIEPRVRLYEKGERRIRGGLLSLTTDRKRLAGFGDGICLVSAVCASFCFAWRARERRQGDIEEGIRYAKRGARRVWKTEIYGRRRKRARTWIWGLASVLRAESEILVHFGVNF